METQSSTQVFEQLLADEDNQKCFDCGDIAGYWASVSNGIFLCLNCSANHRNLPYTLSVVKSVNLDEWSNFQLSLMMVGGNKALKEFLKTYDIPDELAFEQKFRTRACFYYREKIRATAENREPCKSQPSVEEGRELIEGDEDPYLPPKAQKNYDVSGKQAGEEIYDGIKKFVKETEDYFTSPNTDIKQDIVNGSKKVYTGTKNAVVKVGEKVSDPQFQSSVKDVAKDFAHGAKQGATKISDIFTKTEARQEFKNDAKKAGEALSDSVKSFWNNKEDIAKDTYKSMAIGWGKAMSVFTGKKKEPQPSEYKEPQQWNETDQGQADEPLIKNSVDRKSDN